MIKQMNSKDSESDDQQSQNVVSLANVQISNIGTSDIGGTIQKSKTKKAFIKTNQSIHSQEIRKNNF